jgi:hypothetical protein
MIKNEVQAAQKALEIIGSPAYFRVSHVKLQPGSADPPLAPHWIVSADIGKNKGTVVVSVMFPQDMEAVPVDPRPGTFQNKLGTLRKVCRETINRVDEVYLAPAAPPVGELWWGEMNACAESLAKAVKQLWEDNFTDKST